MAHSVDPAVPSALTNLDSLIQAAIEELERNRFSAGSIKSYRRRWEKLACFAREAGFPPQFTQDLASAFLASHGLVPPKESKQINAAERRLVGAVRRLSEFALHGAFQFKGWQKRGLPLSEAFERSLDDHLVFLTRERGIRSTSLRTRRMYLRELFYFLEARGTFKPAEVTPGLLSDFLATRVHFKPHTLASVASAVRGYLRYLFLQGQHARDLSPHLPKIRTWRHDRLPNIWTPPEVEAMLAAIGRESPVGKRNYAIVLLACRLGLRAGDIRSLHLEDIDWVKAQISIRQAKTGVPLVLPLPGEIGEALIDYLQHGRVSSQHREIFLAAHAPFGPFGRNCNLHHVLTACRRRAGVKVPRDKGHGLHSLRHTLATRLLEGGTPLQVISQILGHTSQESTRIYAKLDVEALRSAALDLEEVLDV